jgi:hypothetical protein
MGVCLLVAIAVGEYPDVCFGVGDDVLVWGEGKEYELAQCT